VKNRRFVLLFSFLFGFSGALYAFPQDVDTFYLKALEKAEKAFLSKDYPQAAKEFEVAAFGLAGNTKLKAKALGYLGLTRFYLNDIKACEKNLREAAGLLKEGDWSGLEFAAEARPDLERLLGYFSLTSTGREGSPPEAGTPPKADTSSPPADNDNASRKIPEENLEPNLNVDLLKEGDLVPLELAETPPEVIKKVEAIYPDWARTSGLEPTVIVGALVSETGKVIKTRIIEGAKNAAGFNQAAEQAVRLWRFRPATIKGLRVKVWLPVSVRFRVRAED
jgi:TonB family protein